MQEIIKQTIQKEEQITDEIVKLKEQLKQEEQISQQI
jgi:ferritin